MSRPGFIRVPRTNGLPAVVRADMITALLPQEPKKAGAPPELMIQIGATVTIHTLSTVEQVAKAVLNATGQPMTVHDLEAA